MNLLKHIRDIILLPFTVTVVVPYYVFKRARPNELIPDHWSIQIAGIGIGLIGVALLFYTIFLFGTIGKGTLAPWEPKKKLVVTGPYRFTRNPMISGVLFIVTGESLFLHSTNILWWALTFFIINNIYFLLFEEPGLLNQFGDEYQNYKKNVPRWIPRLTPWTPRLPEGNG